MNKLIPQETIENKIYLIRGQKIMLDRDLAGLYGVKTKTLNQAVKRNFKRFPSDFMFQLSKQEATKILLFKTCFSRSQFVTLKRGYNIKYLPYAFTEQGIAMLSSVLKSEKAVEINILIMRTFVKIRKLTATHNWLINKLKELEQKFDKRHQKHDFEIQTIFKFIRKMMEIPEKPKKKFGFIVS